MELVRLDLRFPRELKEALKRISKERKTGMTALVVKAVCKEYKIGAKGEVVRTNVRTAKRPIHTGKLDDRGKPIRRPRSEYRCFGTFGRMSGLCDDCHYRSECSIISK